MAVQRIEKSWRGARAAGSLLTACLSLGGCSEDRTFDGGSTADASALDGGVSTGFSPSDGTTSEGTERRGTTSNAATNVASLDAAVVDPAATGTAATDTNAMNTPGQPATSSEQPVPVVDGGTPIETVVPGTSEATSDNTAPNTAGPTSITVDASVPNETEPPIETDAAAPADCVLNNNLLPCRLR